MVVPVRVIAIGGAAVALISGSVALGETTKAALPIRAFQRHAAATDAMPRWSRPAFGAERVLASRRVATYADRRRRTSALYVVVTSAERVCVFLVGNRTSGGGCNPRKHLFTRGPVALVEGRYLAGVASNRVRRVVLIGRIGAHHTATLSVDNGFVYDCRAWNGCAGLVVRAKTYDATGKLIGSQRLP